MGYYWKTGKFLWNIWSVDVPVLIVRAVVSYGFCPDNFYASMSIFCIHSSLSFYLWFISVGMSGRSGGRVHPACPVRGGVQHRGPDQQRWGTRHHRYHSGQGKFLL